MSSVQSFMRQRVIGTRTAIAPTYPLNQSPPNNFFQFRPVPGNYVGTYPPGYMFDVSVELNNLLINYSLSEILDVTR